VHQGLSCLVTVAINNLVNTLELGASPLSCTDVLFGSFGHTPRMHVGTICSHVCILRLHAGLTHALRDDGFTQPLHVDV
jgi:hypothetical protein